MSSDKSSTQTTAPTSSTAPDPLVQRQARLRIAACSDKGLVRKNNEDRYLALKVTRSTTPVVTNIDAAQLQFVPEQIRWSLAVADGMGGHAAGEVASTLALTLAVKLAQQGTQWFVEIGEEEAKAVIERVETIMTTVDLGRNPEALGLSADEEFLYVADHLDPTLTVISLASSERSPNRAG